MDMKRSVHICFIYNTKIAYLPIIDPCYILLLQRPLQHVATYFCSSFEYVKNMVLNSYRNNLFIVTCYGLYADDGDKFYYTDILADFLWLAHDL